jgi:hypothetical protein
MELKTKQLCLVGLVLSVFLMLTFSNIILETMFLPLFLGAFSYLTGLKKVVGILTLTTFFDLVGGNFLHTSLSTTFYDLGYSSTFYLSLLFVAISLFGNFVEVLVYRKVFKNHFSGLRKK